MFDANIGFGPEALKDAPQHISERTVSLFDRWQRLRRAYPDAPRFMGTAATSRGIIHWTASAAPNGQIKTDPEMVRGAFDLEPIRKRTAKQRLNEVASRIVKDAVDSYKLTGRVYFPKSIVRDIQAEFWRNGETISEQELEELTYSQIRPMAEQYAAAVLGRCERKFEANNKSLPVAI